MSKMKNPKQLPDTYSTLDALHTQRLKGLIDEKQNIDTYISDANILRGKLKLTTSSVEIWNIEQQLKGVEKNIKNIESGDNINDYLLRSGDILYDYYDAQDKIKKGGRSNISSTKSRPGSVLDLLNIAAKEQGISSSTQFTPSHQQPNIQRNKLLNKYLEKEDQIFMCLDNTYADTWTQCDMCGKEMSICTNEAYLHCASCGFQDFILIDSDKPSYKDPPREVSYYAYKKINHFNEWLAQFQAKESTEIPQEICDAILLQLKKERIIDMKNIKHSKLREILRNMKYSKYYEHIPHIINRLNGQKAPFMNRDDEERLRHMFKEIQPSFKKHCPKGRRNFLSYSYVLYKFCELLEMDEFLTCFSLLKNREKLLLQDKTWKKICEDMEWQFIRTV